LWQKSGKGERGKVKGERGKVKGERLKGKGIDFSCTLYPNCIESALERSQPDLVTKLEFKMMIVALGKTMHRRILQL